jgi:predicted SpoU family rRNA methylase
MTLGNFKVGAQVNVTVVNQPIPHVSTLCAFMSRVKQVDIQDDNKVVITFENGIILETCSEDLSKGLVSSMLA